MIVDHRVETGVEVVEHVDDLLRWRRGWQRCEPCKQETDSAVKPASKWWGRGWQRCEPCKQKTDSAVKPASKRRESRWKGCETCKKVVRKRLAGLWNLQALQAWARGYRTLKCVVWWGWGCQNLKASCKVRNGDEEADRAWTAMKPSKQAVTVW